VDGSKNEGLQVARAVAALSVAYFHSYIALRAFPESAQIPIGPLKDWGYLGVNLFFAISGYVICLVASKPTFSPASFAIKRVFRLFPMYWVAMATIAFMITIGKYRPEPLGHFLYSMTLLPQSEGVGVMYRDGWYESEGSDTAGEGSWHWSKKNATLAIKNPKKDSVLYLKVGNPGGPFKEPQHVTVSLEGGAPIDEFTTTASDPNVTSRTISITAAAWGSRDTAELHLSVDKAYVPNQIVPSSKDSRELGVRVFRAIVVPAGS